MLCDESTDINTQKKLIIYALAIDPQDASIRSLSFFAAQKATDAKGNGLAKKVANEDFITTSFLMEVMPIINRLTLVSRSATSMLH